MIGAMASHDGYLLDNRQVEAGTRFTAMAQLFDPVTFRHVDRLGIGPGRRCWEVGAGGPTVPEGLARRGADVLATDLDTSWLPADGPYEVRRHDLAADPPPDGGFDLVHARLVLVHLPARAAALATLVDALRPGGYLLRPAGGGGPEYRRGAGPAPGQHRRRPARPRTRAAGLRVGPPVRLRWGQGALSAAA